MGLEVVSHIADLVITNPVGATDPISQGDDHIRNIKVALKTDLPNITGVVTASHTQLNYLNSSHGLPDSVLSTNVPLLNAANTFAATPQALKAPSEAGFGIIEIVNAAGSRRLELVYSGTSSGGAYGITNGNVGINAANGNVTISTLDAARLVVDSSLATSSINGVAFSDFARLSQSNVFVNVQKTNMSTPYSSWQISGTDKGYVGVGGGGAIGGLTTADFGINSVSGKAYLATGGTERLVADASGNFDFKGGTVTTNNASASEVGFKGTPPNTQNGNYTLVLADAGNLIRKQSGVGNTITIPANASVAFPDGTCIAIDNDSGSSVSIAITTDTMELAGSGATGTRTLADNGSCMIRKIASTKWRISGAGVS